MHPELNQKGGADLAALRPEPRARVSPTGFEQVRAALGDPTDRTRTVPLLYFAAVLLDGRPTQRPGRDTPIESEALVAGASILVHAVVGVNWSLSVRTLDTGQLAARRCSAIAVTSLRDSSSLTLLSEVPSRNTKTSV